MPEPTRRQRARQIGQRVVSALTADEQAEVVGVLLSRLKPEAVDRVCARLKPAVAKSLRLALAVQDERPAADAASPSRVAEAWQPLMDRWIERVAALENGDGPYVYREGHWDEGYPAFDSFVDDLEAVAREMLLWLDAATATFPAGSLAHAVEDIQDSILELPEWLDAGGQDPFDLGPAATRCIVAWIWRDAGSAARWVEEMGRIIDGKFLAELDPLAVAAFASSLPPVERRAVFDAIRRGKGDLSTVWGRVRLELSAEFDRPYWQRTCEASLDQDWTLGLGLLRACMDESRFEDGVRIADRALSQRSWDGKRRRFREDLLEPVKRSDDMHALLALAEQLGDEDVRAACQIQRQHLRDSADWDAMAALFRRGSSPAVGRLGADWVSGVSDDHEGADWIPWLLDQGDFVTRASAWLASRRIAQVGHGKLGPLATLTVDVLGEADLRAKRPLLHAALEPLVVGRLHARSRRAWLERAHAEELRAVLLDWWRGNIRRLAPDPGTAHRSRYVQHATWLMAVRELDESEYNALRAEWRTHHGRRSNLWSEIASLEAGRGRPAGRRR